MPTTGQATVKRLAGPRVPGTTDGTAYTVPASTTTIVKEVTVVNTTATPAWISLAINGTALTAANAWLAYQKSIPANDVVVFAVSTPMATGDTIHDAQQTTNALTVSYSGTEFA